MIILLCKLLDGLKRIIPASLLALIVFSSLGMASPIKVEFKVAKQKAKNGIVTLRIVNTADKKIKVLAWNTPFEKTISADIFRVKHGKKTMPYLGRLVKRGAPQEKDYVILDKGEERNIDVDISQYYEMPESGKYSIAYKGVFKLKGSKAQRTPVCKAKSSTTYILYDPTEKKTLKIHAKTTNFNGCTSNQKTVINNVHTEAINISLNSKNAMSQASPSLRQERYVIWFGNPDNSRQTTLKTHFNNIYNDLNTKNIVFDCSCTDDYYAYVYASSPYTIYLCDSFWSAGMTGTDSKAGTLVHEMSHFTVVAGTDDHVYSSTSAQMLAEDDPDIAIDNADNYEYFAENTPTLSMDTILPDPFESAELINNLYFDVPISGVIESAVDSDYYTFIAPITGEYTFYAAGDLDTIGTLYGSDHAKLAFNDDASDDNLNFTITHSLTKGQRYYVKVFAYDGDVGGYTLNIAFDTSGKFTFLIPAVYSVMLLQ